jgi:N-acetyl-anhydromuramoyl-L-alanine amidase
MVVHGLRYHAPNTSGSITVVANASPLHIDKGWLRDARHLPSPNANERPAGVAVELLVIHNISLPPGEFGGGHVEQLFLNTLDCDAHPWFDRLRGLRVSAHLLIERSGELTQFVSFEQRAWHAGVSVFEGREACNDFSIGIELEGTDETPYTAAQYDRLLAVTRALMQSYRGIAPGRIVGHCDIAPGRKTDPGPTFDWGRFRAALTDDSVVMTGE